MEIFDENNNDDDIIIKIVKHPNHGTLKSPNGPIKLNFTYEDIKKNKLSYLHDDSETVADNFTMTVSDGSKKGFISKLHDKTYSSPVILHSIVFQVVILRVDDSSPELVKNKGIKFLKKGSNSVFRLITEDILKVKDIDTDDENIVYRITVYPRLGSLKLALHNNTIVQFSQNDINLGRISYVLEKDDFLSTKDRFMFTVEDTKPNKLLNSIFLIEWTRIHFNSTFYNVSEKHGFLKLPIHRTGSLHLDFKASCRLIRMNLAARKNSLIPIVNEVHFKSSDTVCHCIFKINNNLKFERRKHFTIALKSSILVAQPHETTVFVHDVEDEPMIGFQQTVFRISESIGYLDVPIIRKGDLSYELSVMCITKDLTAVGSGPSNLSSGSDFKSRLFSTKSYVTFLLHSSKASCKVKIIDDNLYEDEESFELQLSNLHPTGRISENSTSLVILIGPNDVPEVFMLSGQQEFFYQNNKTFKVGRSGTDLSKSCTVRCGCYIGSKSKEKSVFFNIEFRPSERLANYPIASILSNKTVGEENIVIFLDSATGCHVSEKNNSLTIFKKENKIPVVEFNITDLTVHENGGSVLIPITRKGGLERNFSVHCVAHDGSAHSRSDFEERYLTRKKSLVTFFSQQKESYCLFKIYDDEIYEGIEKCTLELIPFEKDKNIIIGRKNAVRIKINDSEDMTTVTLEYAEYTLPQMFSLNSLVPVKVTIIRNGDTHITSKIRISTIDGSAVAGKDFYPKSMMLKFYPGEKKKIFEVEIFNKKRKFPIFFAIMLDSINLMNTVLGNISSAIVQLPVMSIH